MRIRSRDARSSRLSTRSLHTDRSSNPHSDPATCSPRNFLSFFTAVWSGRRGLSYCRKMFSLVHQIFSPGGRCRACTACSFLTVPRTDE